jgi:Cellulase (glycosyl hydrolase family 5)
MHVLTLTQHATVYYCYCAVSNIIYQNEPHGAATWGLNEPKTDWNKAAERIVQGIVKAVPTFDRLIFVEGVGSDAERWLTPPPPDYELTDPAAIQVGLHGDALHRYYAVGLQ